MYGDIRPIIFAVVFVVTFGILFINLKKLFSYLTIARPDPERFKNPGKRIVNVLKIAIGQSKIFRDKAAGPLHAGIFWGFLVFLFSASEAVIQGFRSQFSWSFLGPLFTAITFSTDVFCAIIIIAIVYAFIRRYIIKVPRLQGDKGEVLDAVIVLGSIFIITVGLLLQNSSLTVFHSEDWAFRPLASAIGGAISGKSAPTLYQIFWWVHIIAIFGFMNYLPFSKHLHVYTSLPNVYFTSHDPVKKVDSIDFEDEEAEKFGAVDIDDLSWKAILDGYSCTHCGRCTSACPANITGKELDPRQIIVQIRERTENAGSAFLKQKKAKESGNGEPQLTEKEQEEMQKAFVGDYENIEALWQCTTCGACVQECPVAIEHVPSIIEMRQSLVMMEANFPNELQTPYGSLENNATPWQFPREDRAKWTEGLNVPTVKENPDFDYLFWVGCAGSFDDRAKKISRAFVKLLEKAGINYAILGAEEQCNGDVARRTGNEYLADMLIKENVETLKNYNVEKILTCCPHCFNIFKNEYPDFNGEYKVIHHSMFLQYLIDTGKLKTKGNGKLDVVYHDSCYMGRYNNVYDEPRKTVSGIPGLNVVEPDRSRSRGLCCGAGGGQMFMEESKGKRVNIERTEELINTGAKQIAANCPFCMTMLTDGVKMKDKEEEVQVKDIAEILLDNLEE